MTASRAASFLGVSRETMRRWNNQGNGPPRCRKGKRYYYVRQVLIEWLKCNAPGSAPVKQQPVPRQPASLRSLATVVSPRG